MHRYNILQRKEVIDILYIALCKKVQVFWIVELKSSKAKEVTYSIPEDTLDVIYCNAIN